MMLRRGISQLIEIFEERIFDRSVQGLQERGLSERVITATLLPPLSDELVLERIWPLLHKRLNISLLWRLRIVNRSWHRSVAQTLEWSALEVVRVDTPGLIRYLDERRERRPPLRERVEDEMKAISLLLYEKLEDFIPQSSCCRLATGGSWKSEASWSSSAGSVTDCCGCAKVVTTCSPDFEVDSESEALSSEGSVIVYYPRHSVRGR